MIDCHAHLADAAFDEDRDQVIQRAQAAGVGAIICVSEGLGDAERVLELARRYPSVMPCLGLHPEAADLDTAHLLCDLIEQQADELVGIGEVGLDYWIAKEAPARERQAQVLSLFVELSNRLDLPLNVHSRSAGHHAIALLRRQGARKVLMHAFDGKASRALEGIEAGYFFSIPPSLLRSVQKQKLVSRLPLSALMLETDSPVLGPSKDERNEPANLSLVAESIAGIKEVSVPEVIEVTTENALRFWRSIGV